MCKRGVAAGRISRRNPAERAITDQPNNLFAYIGTVQEPGDGERTPDFAS
jgi:hypothetical protein